MQLKVEKILFEHQQNFTGEVEIKRGDKVMKVPMEALVRIVAEKVRYDRIKALETAKPGDLVMKLA